MLCHSLFQGGSTDPAPPSPTQTLEPPTEKTVKKKPSFKSKLKLNNLILKKFSMFQTSFQLAICLICSCTCETSFLYPEPQVSRIHLLKHCENHNFLCIYIFPCECLFSTIHVYFNDEMISFEGCTLTSM